MATADPRPTRWRALAGGLAVAACVACCLLPLAAGGLLAGVWRAPLPAAACPLCCWGRSLLGPPGRGGGDDAAPGPPLRPQRATGAVTAPKGSAEGA